MKYFLVTWIWDAENPCVIRASCADEIFQYYGKLAAPTSVKEIEVLSLTHTNELVQVPV